jgi:AraC-like DNA-binding protein
MEPGDAGSRDRDLYARMLRHIEAHVDDPDLSPLQVAQAFFVSPRTLHRLFTRFGETVATTIRTRRLEACRQAMLSPHSSHRSLTDIATQFGLGAARLRGLGELRI